MVNHSILSYTSRFRISWHALIIDTSKREIVRMIYLGNLQRGICMMITVWFRLSWEEDTLYDDTLYSVPKHGGFWIGGTAAYNEINSGCRQESFMLQRISWWIMCRFSEFSNQCLKREILIELVLLISFSTELKDRLLFVSFLDNLDTNNNEYEALPFAALAIVDVYKPRCNKTSD